MLRKVRFNGVNTAKHGNNQEIFITVYNKAKDVSMLKLKKEQEIWLDENQYNALLIPIVREQETNGVTTKYINMELNPAFEIVAVERNATYVKTINVTMDRTKFVKTFNNVNGSTNTFTINDAPQGNIEIIKVEVDGTEVKQGITINNTSKSVKFDNNVPKASSEVKITYVVPELLKKSIPHGISNLNNFVLDIALPENYNNKYELVGVTTTDIIIKAKQHLESAETFDIVVLK